MSGDQLDTHVLTHSFPTRRSSDLTESSRRLAKLAHAPSIKVEATKFTEVGYVGRDVEQIVRDLVESAIVMVRAKKREEMRAQAHHAAENRVIDTLAGPGASETTRRDRKSTRLNSSH